MHTIHHTRAVILKSLASREADKIYWLFTEDFGLVVAVATGVRKSGAKLMSQLIDYSFVDVDLVKGREVWRVVSATPQYVPLEGHTTHPLARAYVRILATLERFVIDEGAHPELFAQMYDAAEMLRQSDARAADPKQYDTLMIWRILASLGYVSTDLLEQHLHTLPLREALVYLDETKTKKLIMEVNATIKETHL